MKNRLNTPNRPTTQEIILLEMKFIQLQLYLAKKSANEIYTLPITLPKLELHLENALRSIHHLISKMDDYKSNTANELQQ